MMNHVEKLCLQEAVWGDGRSGEGGGQRLHITSTSAASLSGGPREVNVKHLTPTPAP